VKSYNLKVVEGGGVFFLSNETPPFWWISHSLFLSLFLFLFLFESLNQSLIPNEFYCDTSHLVERSKHLDTMDEIEEANYHQYPEQPMIG
jgi:hypothetical protein